MNNKKGQILIITLLVLTIIAIVTVSLVGLVNRDVQQVASTEQYEDAYNTSETQLKKVLDVIGKPSIPISQLPTLLNSPTDISCSETQAAQKLYTCSAVNNDFSNTKLTTSITVKDTKDVNDFPIYKDRSFDMNLSGYLDTLNFSWDKNAAIEFELIYNEGGEIKSIRDVYDNGSPRIYTSLAADNPFDPLSTIHPFKFKNYVGKTDDRAVSIRISDIVTLSGAPFVGTPITLKITPRMTDKFDSIILNVRGVNNSLPDQIREFTSKTFDANGGNSTPVANIETKIPLAAQPDSVLDAAILTNGILKNTP